MIGRIKSLFSPVYFMQIAFVLKLNSPYIRVYMSTSKQGINFPDECTSKEEIRAEIDRLDRQIIDLFAERLQYVRAIVKFKQTADDIVAQPRYDEVISSRGQWAAEKGLSAEVFESIYCKLLNFSICEEHKFAEGTNK